VNALTDQTVVIVGGSSGIGLAVARLAALRGAHAVILSRSPTKLDDAVRTVPGRATAIAMDMLDRDAVDRVMASLGAFDHLVLTAVAGELANRAAIGELTTVQVERTFDKLRGFVNVTRAALLSLAANGSITIVTGASAEKPPHGFSVLAAASGSLISFGKALALELAPRRVNVLMSGVVDTPIVVPSQRAATKAWAERSLLVRRFGQPEDIAHAIEFLMSNPYVTASTLIVDGGFVAT
jgi:NAD(P)-dependent dehydrogenase (short-subunit alcohol dehydrogenase family)